MGEQDMYKAHGKLTLKAGGDVGYHVSDDDMAKIVDIYRERQAEYRAKNKDVEFYGIVTVETGPALVVFVDDNKVYFENGGKKFYYMYRTDPGWMRTVQRKFELRFK